DSRHERVRVRVDQALLRQEPGINVVEHGACTGGHVHELGLDGCDLVGTAELLDQVLSEGESRLGRGGSAVNDREASETKLRLIRNQTVPRPRPSAWRFKRGRGTNRVRA